jgi:hypothetical protein
MKRTLVAILSIIYFCISSGFVMSAHYCMGKINKVNVEIIPSENCICGKKATKGCCKTESTFVKLADIHQATYADVSIASPFHIVPLAYTNYNATVASINIILARNNHSPPTISPQPIYILNCVFRI